MEKRNQSSGETVQRILAAAREAFAEQGFNGTTVDAIAQKAGVNKATLYYHIGDKETLYAEVLRTVLENNIDYLRENIKAAKTPEEQLRRYIRTLAAEIEDTPYLSRIMLRELAAGGRGLPEVVLQSLSRILAMVEEILDEGERKGIFVPAIPFMIHMMVLGTLIFYKTSAPFRERSPQLAEKTLKGREKASAEEIAAEVEELIIRALRR